MKLDTTSPDVIRMQRQLSFYTEGIPAFRAMQFRPMVEVLLTEGFFLGEYLRFFKNNNRSNEKPYHNYYHMETVVLNAYEGAVHMDLPFSERRALMLAALFHDYDHSAGLEGDGVNISRALAGLKEAHRHVTYGGASHEQMTQTMFLIRATEYPYFSDPNSTAAAILLDADRMQMYEEHPMKLKNQLLGLKEELEVRRGTFFSSPEFNAAQLGFIDGVRWFSAWGQRKAEARGWGQMTERVRTMFPAQV